MFFRKKQILFKIESTYGTDSTPDGSNAILTRNCQISEPYGGEKVSRNLDRPTLGNDETMNVEPQVTVTFEVEAAGSGTAGDAPAYGPVLRSCGFAETIDAGVDVRYALVSDSFESGTLYYIMDGNLHKLTGCRGNAELMFPRRGFPYYTITITGSYNTPVTAGAYTIDTSAFVRPVPVNKVNTTLDMNGFTPRAESFSINLNNEVVNRNIINFDERLIVDRAPAGEVAFEIPAVADDDIYSDFIESHSGVSTGAWELVHGTTAGNIIEVSAPAVQMHDISVSDSDGVAVGTCPFNLIPSDAGDDELLIIVK